MGGIHISRDRYLNRYLCVENRINRHLEEYPAAKMPHIVLCVYNSSIYHARVSNTIVLSIHMYNRGS